MTSINHLLVVITMPTDVANTWIHVGKIDACASSGYQALLLRAWVMRLITLQLAECQLKPHTLGQCGKLNSSLKLASKPTMGMSNLEGIVPDLPSTSQKCWTDLWPFLQAERERMSLSVPDEPPEDCKEKMCTLRIRFPGGEVEQRRFLAEHSLQVCCNLDNPCCPVCERAF